MHRRRLLRAASGGAVGLAWQAVSAAQVPDDIKAHYVRLVARSWVSDGAAEMARLDTYAVELDDERVAQRLVPIASANGLKNIGDIVPGTPGKGAYTPLTDTGILAHGTVVEAGTQWRFAILTVRRGRVVYALIALGAGEQVSALQEIYDTLFDPSRREDDLLPTEGEVPSALRVVNERVVA